MTAWLAMIVAAVASATIGKSAVRIHEEEGILDALWIGKDHRALTEIVDSKRRQHNCHPGKLDRAPAEMSEIGVERLRPRNREEHCAQGDEGKLAMRQ